MSPSSDGFSRAAAAALADPQLRRNLRAATHTIRRNRAAVVAELPEWEQLRETAARIKDEALATLDDQLDRLEQSVTAAGGQVHCARDSTEACALVAELMQARGASEAIKMKSLTTDEIGLDEALAREGITAWATDLAEMIIQLAGDRPSHIVVPAIHLSRGEIRDLFARSFDLPELTDDPVELTGVARRVLRERFMRAPVGITGANFAVAETGTIALVESEANGRMCTTLPRTLISIMGIEKVLPRLSDLAVMVRMLARSAVGARMSSDVTLFTGVHDGDGPEEFHLILLDDGRTRALADPVGREALRCIRCGACLNTCPVYQHVGGHAYEAPYPGPIGSIISPQLAGMHEHLDLPFASSLCGACAEVCPMRIDIPRLLVHLRERILTETSTEPVSERVAMRLLLRTLADRRRYETAQRAVRLGRRPLRSRLTPSPARPDRRMNLGARNARHTRADLPLRTFGPRTMNPAREETLAAIRSALTRPAPARPHQPCDPRPEPPPLGDEQLLELFLERAAGCGATVTTCTPDSVAEALRQACARHRASRLVIPSGLPAQWRPDGIKLVADQELTVAALDELDGVITGAAVAIAESGTVVLDGSPDQGRRALTLIPDLHICVVEAKRIVPRCPTRSSCSQTQSPPVTAR